MPRRKWIDKSASTTYTLRYREQNDPRIHEEGATEAVFQEKQQSQSKGKDRSDLESELFGSSLSKNSYASRDGSVLSIRDNEGEAAEHGVYYDDTAYDYMQHMREMGTSGDAFFVEAMANTKGKGKAKVSLDQALKELDLEHERAEDAKRGKLVDEDILPSRNLHSRDLEAQQAVPEEIAGFQPDMDPRLREVLEALDDDAYVDDEEEDDFFKEIAKGQELSLDEFEDLGYQQGVYDDDEEGWESDDTARPASPVRKAAAVDIEQPTETLPLPPEIDGLPPADDTIPDAPFDPLAAYHAAKAAPKAPPKPANSILKSSLADRPSTILSSASMLSRGGKKRKGALTNPSAFSMTSSALARTEGQTFLDARFEKTLATYAEEDEDEFPDDGTASMLSGGVSLASGMTGLSGVSHSSRLSTASQAPELVRKDFDTIMDDFLAGHSMSGKRRVKKGAYQSGMQQLDEIRKELGPPRLKTRS